MLRITAILVGKLLIMVNYQFTNFTTVAPRRSPSTLKSTERYDNTDPRSVLKVISTAQSECFN